MNILPPAFVELSPNPFEVRKALGRGGKLAVHGRAEARGALEAGLDLHSHLAGIEGWLHKLNSRGLLLKPGAHGATLVRRGGGRSPGDAATAVGARGAARTSHACSGGHPNARQRRPTSLARGLGLLHIDRRLDNTRPRSQSHGSAGRDGVGKEVKDGGAARLNGHLHRGDRQRGSVKGKGDGGARGRARDANEARREDFEDLAAPETDRVAEAQQSSNTAHAARPEKIWLAFAPVSDPNEAPVA
eukprot:CAMPEP_0204094408 /NCGR_PEP_ID=MMETSP0360-20130528/190911_1 /ASSEMBLY_ACC=CAM_ASM_000342 /TAXON_ID=268821 /ORGANISM="Scrippsiella Hangoei, Strain SHTV-5" /LENGTH=244 /DNA_ID=CAMNT_0051043719 /DNA_START=803 /DNA_END=1539 /DNA_ORIENTATION=+